VNQDLSGPVHNVKFCTKIPTNLTREYIVSN